MVVCALPAPAASLLGPATPGPSRIRGGAWPAAAVGEPRVKPDAGGGAGPVNTLATPAYPLAPCPPPGRPDVIKDKRKTAFVRNVPFRATEEDIVDFFSQARTRTWALCLVAFHASIWCPSSQPRRTSETSNRSPTSAGGSSGPVLSLHRGPHACELSGGGPMKAPPFEAACFACCPICSAARWWMWCGGPTRRVGDTRTSSLPACCDETEGAIPAYRAAQRSVLLLPVGTDTHTAWLPGQSLHLLPALPSRGQRRPALYSVHSMGSLHTTHHTCISRVRAC